MASSSFAFLNNKVALITGGGGTIGEAIASKLLEHGAKAILVGRNLQRLEATKKRLLQEHKHNNNYSNQECTIELQSCDVTNEESVVEMFQKLDEQRLEVELLINNAGISIPGQITDISGADFSQVMQVNVTGPFLCARETLKRMKNNGGGGRIINIGSLSAQSPRPDSAPYTTSKFALLGLTQCLALDARKYNVAVGIIHPGNVASAILSPEEAERRQKEEGLLQPQDVANCVVTMANLPYSANVLEMTVLPTRQPLVGRG